MVGKIMGISELITDDWVQTASNLYTAFIEWFMTLQYPGQIMTGVLMILALIAVGYILYGTVWLAYQIVKASILFSIIVVYLTIVWMIISIEIVFTIFGAIEKERVVHTWNMAGYHIKNLLFKAYPSEKREAPTRPVMKGSENQGKLSYPTKNPTATPVIIVEEEAPVSETGNRVDAKQQNSGSNTEVETPELPKFFCPNCGIEFSPRMIDRLKSNTYTFCEACGEKFYRRDMSSA